MLGIVKVGRDISNEFAVANDIELMKLGFTRSFGAEGQGLIIGLWKEDKFDINGLYESWSWREQIVEFRTESFEFRTEVPICIREEEGEFLKLRRLEHTVKQLADTGFTLKIDASITDPIACFYAKGTATGYWLPRRPDFDFFEHCRDLVERSHPSWWKKIN